MQPFEVYLNEHKLEALTVAVNARIRYMTVYNAMKGLPITPKHAQKIRQAVFALCGVPFSGSFVLTVPEPFEDQQTIPIKKLPKHNLI